GVESRGSLAEERRELAEDEGTVALGEYILELFEERVELRRRNVRVLLVDEGGVEAQHAEQRERAEDDEPVLVHVVEQAEQFLPFPLQERVVQLAVLGIEVDGEHLLLLRGQVGG